MDARQVGVRQLAIDAVGSLWVISESGLCRFDGAEWECPRSSCKSLVHGDGQTWAACEPGVVLQLEGENMRPHALPSAIKDANLLAVGAGELWFTAPSATLSWKARENQPQQRLSTRATSIAFVGPTAWIATNNGIYQHTHLGATLYSPVVAHKLAVSQGGRVLAAVKQGTYDDILDLSKAHDGSSPLAPQIAPITSMFVDDARALLWATGGGVQAFSLSDGGAPLLSMSMQTGLPYPLIDSQVHDPSGAWFGTQQGLAQMRIDTPIFNFGQPEGMSNYAGFALTTDAQGALWIAQGKGLTRYLPSSLENFDASPSLVHIDLRSIAVGADGAIWSAGMINPLVKLDTKSRRFVRMPLAGQPEPLQIQTLRIGPSGTLWMGLVNGGLGRKAGDKFVSVFPGGDGENRVHDVVEGTSGTVWLARGDGTVVGLDGERQNTYAVAPGVNILCLHEDASRTLWAGTGGAGLYRIKNGQVARLTKSQGLWDDRVHAITDDGKGWLWMSTVTGLSRVAQSQAEAVMDGWASRVDSIAYEVEDGLRTNEASRGFSPSSAKDRQGRIWFSMVTGAVSVDPQALEQASPPSAVRIDAFYVDGVLQRDAQRLIPVGRGAISFSLAATELWTRSRTRYRVFLAGSKEGWRELGKERHAEYANLRPGKYHFIARAFSIDRPDAFVQVERRFELLPAFYQRAWFLAVLGLSCAAAATIWWRSKQRRAARLQSVLMADRTRIAQDIHDSLEQDLSGIKMQVSAASLWMAKDPERALRHLDNAEKLVIDGMVDMRSAIWGLRAGWVDTNDMCTALQQRLGRIAAAADIQLSFETKGAAQPVASLVATQLFYIAREAVTNAIKHAHARQVTVTIDLTQIQVITLLVEDDGVGFAEGAHTGVRQGGLGGGFGLESMRARAQLAGGTLELSTKGMGTSLKVVLPRR
ncbi:MAG: histidine kinase [Deltaproteobacteria bacterium]|nr:histidine kinase [Deltaproteobacteria bacterium]